MQLIIRVLLLNAILLFACKDKKLSPPIIETPVFKLTGVISDQEVEISAGVNSYQMVPYYTIKGEQYSFIGAFSSENCQESCSGEFSFRFIDRNTISKYKPDSAISKGEYNFSCNKLISKHIYQFKFEDLLNELPINQKFYWDFDDGSSSTERNPMHVFNGMKNIYNVCLIYNNNNCASSICMPINVNNNNYLEYSFEKQVNTIIYSAEPASTNVVTYEWTLGSGAKAEGKAISVNYGTKTYEDIVCLKTTNTNKQTRVLCKNVPIESDSLSCLANFNYTGKTEYELDTSLTPNSIIVSYNSPYGNVYNSKRCNNISELFVEEIENYTDKINPDLTLKKVSLIYNGYLYNKNDSIKVESLRAIIAVEFPK